ncbi:helix-turn-helix domain-containing protein [Cystobacter fuscus]
MARQQPGVELTPSEHRRWRKASRFEPRSGVTLRASVVLWSAQGLSVSGIARALGVGPRMVYSCRGH